MTKRITHNDIYVTKLHPSGAIECSAIVDGYRESRVYFDYTKREAQHMFYREINNG